MPTVFTYGEFNLFWRQFEPILFTIGVHVSPRFPSELSNHCEWDLSSYSVFENKQSIRMWMQNLEDWNDLIGQLSGRVLILPPSICANPRFDYFRGFCRNLGEFSLLAKGSIPSDHGIHTETLKPLWICHSFRTKGIVVL